jgi:hypothetical protein
MKALKLTMITAALALMIIRLVLFVAWQYPAPVGDSPLFLAVSHYHCTDGTFRSPIFPIDSELGRYTWHGIFQPALISALSPDCSMQGHYVALTVLMLATFGLSWFATRRLGLNWLIIPFAAIIFALQAKQGFRPEIVAIFLALLTEHLIVQRSKFFIAPLAAMAWTHPIAFVVYVLYIASYQDKAFYQGVAQNLWAHVATAAAVNAAFLLTYPFPIGDHIHGLLLQGQKVSAASSAEWPKRIVNYALISHFFPAFGISLLACILFLMNHRKRIALMFLVVYYFWVRKPELVYNVMPLFVAMLYQVTNLSFKKTKPLPHSTLASGTSTERQMHFGGGLVVAIAVLAMAGLAQGIARDVASIQNYGASIESSKSLYTRWKAEGHVVCAAPMFFTQFLPFDQFTKSYGSVLEECVQALSTNQPPKLYDVFSNSGHAHTEATCHTSHERKGNGVLGKIFKSDSGYSFSICSTTPQDAAFYLSDSKALK